MKPVFDNIRSTALLLRKPCVRAGLPVDLLTVGGALSRAMKRCSASGAGKTIHASLRTMIVVLAACSGSGTAADGAPAAIAEAVDAGTSGTSSVSTAEVSATGPTSESSAAVAGNGPSTFPAGGGAGGGAGASSAVAAGSGGAASTAGAPAAGDRAATGGAGAPGVAAPAAAAGSGGSAAPPRACDSVPAPVIYVIGDSTASVYEADLYPRMGWAQPLQEYFRPACAKVQDKALSGRSSKSFLDEGAWTPIRAALREGDFVLIQFGHNDEKRDDPARFTEPFGSYQEHLAMYIDDTLAAKATPVLLTPIERNKWSSGKLNDTHGEYPEAVRQLAEMRQLSLVDMTMLTHAHLEEIGQSAASKLFMNLAPGEFPNYPSGNADDTHLQDKGAHIVAEIALAELARQGAPVAALLDRVPAP